MSIPWPPITIPLCSLSSTTRRVYFQQDGAPIHKATSTSRWLRLHGVRQFNRGCWPAQSLDMNPIEHVWPHIVRALSGQVYTSRDGLWEAIEHAAQAIPAEAICKLYTSMPRRLAAVIEAKGGHTKY